MANAIPTGGEIRADAAYPVPDFQRINGMGNKALRKARREGLQVVRIGRRNYILGRDWLAHLEKKKG